MTKLEAWKVWCEYTGTGDRLANEFTLENSSHGKAFSFAWDAASASDKLSDKMLAFIETRDGDYFDDWYASPRDFAATILSDFAEHLGIELVVPAYIPRKTRPQVDREALLKALMPGIRDLFDIEYKKMDEKMQAEWNKQGEMK